MAPIKVAHVLHLVFPGTSGRGVCDARRRWCRFHWVGSLCQSMRSTRLVLERGSDLCFILVVTPVRLEQAREALAVAVARTILLRLRRRGSPKTKRVAIFKLVVHESIHCPSTRLRILLRHQGRLRWHRALAHFVDRGVCWLRRLGLMLLRLVLAPLRARCWDYLICWMLVQGANARARRCRHHLAATPGPPCSSHGSRLRPRRRHGFLVVVGGVFIFLLLKWSSALILSVLVSTASGHCGVENVFQRGSGNLPPRSAALYGSTSRCLRARFWGALPRSPRILHRPCSRL
mmetsp:Transcript_6468/g.12261  ORF Transcript_6468/g.12261 Transcript_6468/m.12261 type:complete len:290 (-) Transcript_6468:585-1454(-)